MPTSVTADPADANALFLRFDGSVQALCDDLDKPSFEQLQAARHHSFWVILDIGAKLHYLPRPDDPSRWLRATDGTPAPVLDPQLVNAPHPIHYYRHFRVSGANPRELEPRPGVPSSAPPDLEVSGLGVEYETVLADQFPKLCNVAL